MMIYTSILAGPLILIVWTIDTWLFLASLRLILGRVARIRDNQLYLSLRALTDGIPTCVDEWLALQRLQRNPRWLPWLVVLSGVVVIRHLLIWGLLSVA